MKSKSRIELRFDTDLHTSIKGLADESGVSVNQLVQGVMAWAVDNAYPGLPSVGENGPGYVESTDDVGVWFGTSGYDDEGNPVGGGEVVFALDFSSRRSVRKGREVYP
jgi:HicB family